MGAITFREAAAETPRTKALSQHVYDALLKDDVWSQIDDYVRGIAPTGSVQYNHANVVRILRQWDKEENHGLISSYDLTDKALWNVIAKVLRYHFDLSRGIVVGLLEKKPEAA